MQLLAIHCMMQKGVPNPTGSWYMLKPSVALINWHKIFYCNVKLSHKVFSADGALLGFISQGAHLLSGKITVYSCWKAIKTERAPQVKNASLISPASDHLTRSILFFPHQIFGRSEGIYWCWCSYSTAQSGNLSEGYAARTPLIWNFETTTWLLSPHIVIFHMQLTKVHLVSDTTIRICFIQQSILNQAHLFRNIHGQVSIVRKMRLRSRKLLCLTAFLQLEPKQ